MRVLRSFFLTVVLGFSVSVLADTKDNIKKRECEATEDVKIVVAEYDLDRRGESDLEGKIVNRSSDDEYEDVQVRINFFDDDDHHLGSQVHTLDIELGESQTEEFMIKFRAPKDTDRITYEVVCAVEE